ncbi:ribonuclease P protein component [Mucilaginibacter gotjawali]|uniref:Ribonuclease P n=2 Tax=Mucilaginibacter gotjawali TaxID=1550579 RepID=A0A0X8X157_9SPHI|nr:ribonuclease P protein component [Mucilaginibacter gotjawali]MBB3053643.1 ribonuclease P protein component [Mucilaginibacter gotjawali]BAU53902.1 ribonuclease P [Mucilaginibacter gotjawali]
MYTFKKEERLCNKKLIDELFHNGSSFLCYPFKVSWLFADFSGNYPVQVVFSVPKRRFNHATDRNLVKRRTRETYRRYKQEHLYAPLNAAGKKIVLSVGYIGKEIASYDLAEKKMLKLLKLLSAETSK